MTSMAKWRAYFKKKKADYFENTESMVFNEVPGAVSLTRGFTKLRRSGKGPGDW